MVATVIRWLAALCCGTGCVKLMMTALTTEGGLVAVPPILFSVALFILTLLLVTPETVIPLAEWFSRPFTAIFFPNETESRPPLNYHLARRYRLERRWKDAARQYAKIIRYYPEAIDAYVELVDVADQMGNAELREEYAAKFRKVFGQEVAEFELSEK